MHCTALRAAVSRRLLVVVVVVCGVDTIQKLSWNILDEYIQSIPIAVEQIKWWRSWLCRTLVENLEPTITREGEPRSLFMVYCLL
jgi:hypothetical protein